MECLPICYQGKTVGSLQIVQDGLYIQFLASIQPQPCDGILRLWAAGKGELFYLGIPVPDGEQMRLNRRVAAAHIIDSDWTHGLLAEKVPDWQPFSGIVAGYHVRDGIRRTVADGTEIGIVFDPEQPFDALLLLPRLRAKCMNGKLWLVLQRLPDENT